MIVLFNRSRNRYLRMSSIFIGLGTGYLIAWWAGMIDFASVQHYGGVNLPVPFKYGLAFDLSSFIAIALIFVITATLSLTVYIRSAAYKQEDTYQ